MNTDTLSNLKYIAEKAFNAALSGDHAEADNFEAQADEIEKTLGPEDRYAYLLWQASVVSGDTTEKLDQEVIESCGSDNIERKLGYAIGSMAVMQAFMKANNAKIDQNIKYIEEAHEETRKVMDEIKQRSDQIDVNLAQNQLRFQSL